MALLNASLTELARHTIRAFADALTEAGIDAPLFVTQNDGTVIIPEVLRPYMGGAEVITKA